MFRVPTRVKKEMILRALPQYHYNHRQSYKATGENLPKVLEIKPEKTMYTLFEKPCVAYNRDTNVSQKKYFCDTFVIQIQKKKNYIIRLNYSNILLPSHNENLE